MLLFSCQKPEVSNIQILPPVDNTTSFIEDCVTYNTIDINSTWGFPISDKYKLKHTDGLESMAISGSINLLNQEICRTGITNSSLNVLLGANHASDIEKEGWASTIGFGDYWIAMYHPSRRYPDSFLIVHKESLDWFRYELGKRGSYRGPIRLHSSGTN